MPSPYYPFMSFPLEPKKQKKKKKKDAWSQVIPVVAFRQKRRPEKRLSCVRRLDRGPTRATVPVLRFFRLTLIFIALLHYYLAIIVFHHQWQNKWHKHPSEK